MRDASATVVGGSSPTLRLGLSFVLATVMLLALLVGAAHSGPLARHAQTAQQQNALTPDELKALQQKAEKGDAVAQFLLAVYEKEHGVPQDEEQVVGWTRKAAEQGFAGAQSNLGLMYANGQGVPQDYAQAVAWYRKAAEQGNAVAQFKLGVLYRNGQGVSQDVIEAFKWSTIARDRLSGDQQKENAAGRETLAKRMTSAQIAEAQKRASEWTAAFEKRKK